jgi:hypothetical protein
LGPDSASALEILKIVPLRLTVVRQAVAVVPQIVAQTQQVLPEADPAIRPKLPRILFPAKPSISAAPDAEPLRGIWH